MRRLTQAIHTLLMRFHAARAVRSSLIDEEKDQLLQALDQSLEPACVPSLLAFLPASDDESVGDAIASAIQKIIQKCDPPTLAQMDVMVREMSPYMWPAIHHSDAMKLARGLTGVLGALSFHGNGYVREEAVRGLAKVYDGEELAFLLIRLNDWVKVVREAARQAVSERIRPEYAIQFARCLSLIDRLRAQGRDDHRPIAEAILDQLRQGGRAALREVTRSGDRLARRLSFRELSDGTHPDQIPVLSEALESNDTVIRLWAARELRNRLDGIALRETLKRMERDRFMPVRREALYGYVEKSPEARIHALNKALLDPHRSMREAARFHLRQFENQEFADFYRAKLADAEHGRTAIEGLGETGMPADVMRLSHFLVHRDVRKRIAAVRAIGRLGDVEIVDSMLVALQDSSPRVRKAALDALQPRLNQVTPQRLWSIFEASQVAHVRRLTLSLIAELRWWEGAPLLVMASGDGDESVRTRAIEGLHKWRLNSFRLSVRPSREQFSSLENAFQRHESELDRLLQDDLRSVLSYARRGLA